VTHHLALVHNSGHSGRFHLQWKDPSGKLLEMRLSWSQKRSHSMVERTFPMCLLCS